ncbi:MAG: hypothetical protein AB7N91_20380 [Candidatus Tectimicrobiota bacterium]
MTAHETPGMTHSRTEGYALTLSRSRYATDNTALFLTQQAADAKVAMQRSIVDIKHSAGAALNVRWWTQQYPWYGLGVSAVLGFLTMHRLLAPSPPPKPAAPAAASPERPGWFHMIFDMVGQAAISALMMALRGGTETTEQSQIRRE